MPADLMVKARYEDGADEMFLRASCFAEMMDVTKRITTYDGLPAERMQAGRSYKTDVKVFGLFSSNGYEIRIDSLCPVGRKIETSEFGEGVKSWRHTLEIKPDNDGSVWIDRITIDAGAMTPIISRYARFMYRHRHASRQATSITTSLNRACRPSTRDLPVFHPADHRF